MKTNTLFAKVGILFLVLVAAVFACTLQPPTGDIEDRVNGNVITNATVNVGETVTFTAINCFCPDAPYTIAEYHWMLPSQAYCISGDNTSVVQCKFFPPTPTGTTYRVYLNIKCSHGIWNLTPIYVDMTVNAVSGPWYVSSTTGDDSKTGRGEWANAFRNIQTAIDSASSGDTILVREGTYYGQLDLKGKNIDVHSCKEGNDSQLAPEITIIDANQDGTAVLFRGNETSSCQLKGFTIRNGVLVDHNPVLYLKLDETTGTNAPDISGHNHNGTLKYMENNDWIDGVLCKALDFDGSNDYVLISGYKGITGTASRTCSAWIKSTYSGAYQIIMSWGNDQTGGKWIMRLQQSSGRLSVGIGGGYVEGTKALCDGPLLL
jgi:hypothetical protein